MLKWIMNDRCTANRGYWDFAIQRLLRSREFRMTSIEEAKPSAEVFKERFKDVPQKQLVLYQSFASESQEWRDQKTKRLLRKVDLRLLPLLFVMWVLNFLDRSNLAQARLGKLEKDLGMHGTDFNLATSILFVVSSFCRDWAGEGAREPV